MKDGIYDLSWEDYLALDRVNISTLLEMDKSPQHYRSRVCGDASKDTAALRFGRIGHVAVLEPERFDREVVCCDLNRNSNAWKRFLEEHASQLIVKSPEHRLCLSLQVAVREHPVAGPLLAEGEAEQTILWTHEATGIECKSRLDWIAPNAIVDLKTARDCTPNAFARSSASLHYHTKAAYYQDALATATGRRLPYFLVVAEKTPPYAVAVYQVTDDVLRIGRLHYEGLLRQLVECRAKDEWPGPNDDGVADLQLPAWALTGDDDVELIIGGERISV